MVFGNASVWVTGLRDVHEEIVAVIQRVWPQVARRFTTTDKEDDITDQLVAEIQQQVDGRDKWLVQREHQLLLLNKRGRVKGKLRIDIAVFFTLHQKIYIAYECKRLHVRFPSGFKDLADEYVSQGMRRFLVGKYAPDLFFGVMLGYVMDSNVINATHNVSGAIDRQKRKLHCHTVEELPNSGVMKRLRTLHSIKNLGPTLFTIQHGLLPLTITKTSQSSDSDHSLDRRPSVMESEKPN